MGNISELLSKNVIQEDVLKYMATMPDASVHLIIADLPYFRVKGEFDYSWDTETEYILWLLQCLRGFRRVLTDDGTLMLWGGLGKEKTTLCRIAVAVEDEKLFNLQNWITQRNTRGIGTKRNYMSAREELLFYTKSGNYTFNIPYTEEKSLRKDLGFNGRPRKMNISVFRMFGAILQRQVKAVLSDANIRL